MNRIRHWQGITLPGLAVLAFNALAQTGGPAPQWGAHLDLEGKLGSQRSLGEADVFLPLAQDGRSLVFANLRGRFDDHDSREFNLGLGWRRMQADGWNLGGYGYFDRRRSNHGNYFNQATFGAEALGPDWDWRANLYLPFGDRVRGLGADSRASLSGASIQVVTTSREERALKGFDAEAGWRTPLFGRDDPRQLRLYFGGYRFSDDKAIVAGPRVRAELALEEVPALWKGAKLFLSAEAQYDSPRGSQGFLSLRLRIPLDKDSRHGALSAQARRMTAPIVRDVDIVTQSRVSSTLVETATQTAGGQAITVLDSATTAGAALPGAVAAAGANSTVILSGSFNTTAPVTLQTGQTLMGAGTLSVTTPSGRSASLTTPTATVSATVGADSAIHLASNSVLRGMTINSGHAGSGGGGVTGSLINGATIANNTITATDTAGVIALQLVDSSNITVTGNSLAATSSAGSAIALEVMIAGPGSYSAVVNNNTLSAAGTSSTAIRFLSPGPGSVTVSGSGNVRAAGTCYVALGIVITGSIGFTDGTTCPP